MTAGTPDVMTESLNGREMRSSWRSGWVSHSQLSNTPTLQYPILHYANGFLQLQRTLGEKFFDLRFFRDQSLLVGKGDERLEHLAVLLDAVRIWINAEHLLRLRQIFFAKKERRGDAVRQFRVEMPLGFYEAGVKIKRHP